MKNNVELKRKREELKIEQLEEKFMETFKIDEIERWYCNRYECWVSERPHIYSHNCGGMCGMCTNLDKRWVYPKISDSMYMELMVLIQKENLITEDIKDIKIKNDLKEFILEALLQNTEEVKQQVQELFK